MLVQDLLRESAERFPTKVALVNQGQRWTYAQIENQANRLAHALLDQGVQRGDRVILYLGNTIETVVSLFAVLKAGAVFAIINPATKLDKLEYIVNNCQASGIITTTSTLKSEGYERLAQQCPTLRFLLCNGSQPYQSSTVRMLAWNEAMASTVSPSPPPERNIDLDLACLIYTSGSTGEPKGVMSDHSNVLFATQSIIQYLENQSDDIVLSVLPLSFDYGLYQVFMVFKFGGTLILEVSFAYPAMIFKQMESEQVTGFPGVPTMFALVTQMDLSVYNLASLRYLTNTAASLPPSHILALRQKFPQARIYSMYGLTETKRTLYLPPEQLETRPGSVGKAIPGTEVWLEDSQGKRLGPGQVGELVVRGRHVMRGYWAAPELSAQRFQPGPLPGERVCHTGDLFRMDEEGYLYFVGRGDDMIKSRGEKVAPKEIENVLYGMAGVVEAAVVGVPDLVLGQAIKAYLVVSDTSLTASRVLEYCRARLEPYLVPQQIEFRTSLPKTSSGKINKQQLATCVV